MLGIFNKKKKPAKAYDGPPIDPQWVRNRRGKFHRLLHLDPVAEGLQKVSGVYVIWHSGVKPEWVYVGRSDDLALTIEDVAENDEIMDYEKFGGLYVTWSPILKDKQNGVLRFLYETMQPMVDNPAVQSIKDGPISVVVPKRREQQAPASGASAPESKAPSVPSTSSD